MVAATLHNRITAPYTLKASAFAASTPAYAGTAGEDTPA